MLSLYLLPHAVLVTYSALFFAGGIGAMSLFFLLWLQKEQHVKKRYLWGILFVALHLLLATQTVALTAIPEYSGRINNTFFSGYGWLYCLDVIPWLLGLTLVRQDRRLLVLCCGMLLPLFFFGTQLFAIVFVLCNLLVLSGCMLLLQKQWVLRRQRITKLSFKEAVDHLVDGILYADAQGRPLLLNPTMTQLLQRLGFAQMQQAKTLWANLCLLPSTANYTLQSLDDRLLLRWADGDAWLFSYAELSRQQQSFIQLLAINITEEDMLTRQLEQTNAALASIGKELSHTLAQLEQTVREREIWRMKMHLHDKLGQLLSILQQHIEANDNANFDEVVSLLHGFSDILRGETPAGFSQDLGAIRDSFSLIGTQIAISGELPPQPNTANAFLHTIREAATNAVRHGRAKNILVTFAATPDGDLLSIQNDGTLPDAPLHYGSGIAGIARHATALGGTLTICDHPQFCVSVTVPRPREEYMP